jgi:hypothetical protein
MNKGMLVIIIAIVATLISTLLQILMRGREISPTVQKSIWGVFLAGVSVLIITVIIMIAR